MHILRRKKLAGWVETGWMDGKAGLRIAYSNQKTIIQDCKQQPKIAEDEKNLIIADYKKLVALLQNEKMAISENKTSFKL